MRRETLEAMSLADIDEYAKILGVDTTAKKTKASKISEIEKRRERVCELSVMGEEFSIPMKRLHDQRVANLASKEALGDEEAMDLIRLVLGDEQYLKLLELVTDEDGTVDSEGLGFAIYKILTNEELKNF